jgi:hypothetical protein
LIKYKSRINELLLTQVFRGNVTNAGTPNGDDVVLAYIVPPQVLRDGQTLPIKQLFGFQRVNLNVGEKKTSLLSI